MSVRAKKHLGQHFLKDENIAKKIANSLVFKGCEKVLEIGPGMGALTNVIIKDGVEVTAMDIDPMNIEFLEKKMKKIGNINFICGDIMKADLEFIKNSSYRIIGNLPYNISTQIIIRLLELSDHIKDMHFLVQKEVAEKICGTSSSKNWGKLSIKIGLFFNSQKLFDVPPESFDIKPKVDSSFIRLTPVIDDFIMPKNKKDLFNIIDMSFSTRRKNIKNNLKKLNIDWSSLQLDPSARAEDLSIQDFVNIALSLEK